MSALVAAPGKTSKKHAARPGEQAERPALRPLATPGRRMARLPFLIVLIAAFGLGMAGLLLLNTTLQNQEFEARRLNSQASQLTYVQDDLQSQLQTVSSPGSLAQKAYAQGMRPNVRAAFLVLPDGTVKGNAKTTKGTEMSNLKPGSGEKLTAARAAAEAAEKAAKAAAANPLASPSALPSTGPSTNPSASAAPSAASRTPQPTSPR
jgi:cell division protein FtsL